MNTVNIIGRLTKDVELRKTPYGKLVANFTLAVQDTREKAYFIRCNAWDQKAELLEQYTAKGTQVGISGKLTQRTYDKNGQTVEVVEVRVNDITLIGSKDAPQATQKPKEAKFDTGPTLTIDDDSLPF